MRSAAHYPRTYIHIARLFWTGTARSLLETRGALTRAVALFLEGRPRRASRVAAGVFRHGSFASDPLLRS